MITDEENMNKQVILMLSSAISPSITDISIQGESGFEEIWPSPFPLLFSNKSQSFMIKGPFSENILLSGNLCGEQIDIVIPVTRIEDNLGMKQLFSRSIIADYEAQYLYKNEPDIKNKIIELSLKASILSKFTSFIGVDFFKYEQRARKYFTSKCGKHGYAKKYYIDEFTGKPVYTNIDHKSSSHKDYDPVYSIDEMLYDKIKDQKVNGSWTDFEGVDADIEAAYGHIIASTIAAIVFIKTHFENNMIEFSLIIKKAFKFLMTQNKDIDWEGIVDKLLHK